MALKKLKYIEIEEDFKLIGIHSQLEGYKLAFNLNKFLRISLKNFDYRVTINKVDCVFEVFIHFWRNLACAWPRKTQRKPRWPSG